MSKLDEVSGLLGNITRKRESGDLKPSPVQTIVQPISKKSSNSKEFKSKNSLEQSQEVSGAKQGGRPSLKHPDVDYMKISPRIPRKLRQELAIAMTQEKLLDNDGNVIPTLDEAVAYALQKLLNDIKKS